ncbi:hypothetical protein ElyMa_004048400 [Elysia marginata]|uniref:Uncharacterized protein n=1 Tax=Elysia marginata TaxID=1093978 RepID=A0AAV4G5S3_9GAST|nr:hypothetical protein ElyMa_004048400 [Elysia marginata]
MRTDLAAMEVDSDTRGAPLLESMNETGNSQKLRRPRQPNTSRLSVISPSSSSSADREKNLQPPKKSSLSLSSRSSSLLSHHSSSSSSLPCSPPTTPTTKGTKSGVHTSSGVIVLSLIKLSLWAEVLLLRGVGSEDPNDGKRVHVCHKF